MTPGGFLRATMAGALLTVGLTVHTGAAIKQSVKLAPIAHDKGVNPFK